MAAPALKTSDISLPVLQKTTSARVNSVLSERGLSQSADDADLDSLPAPPPELLNFDDSVDENESALDQVDSQRQTNPDLGSKNSLHNLEEDAVNRLQAKYASPENILPPADKIKDSSIIHAGDIENKSELSSADLTHVNVVSSVAEPDEISNTINKVTGGPGSVSAFSDASSDVSDATTSAPSATSATSSSNAAPAVPASFAEGITETDIQQVDMFYRSHKTDIRVCSCLVNMYFSATKTLERNQQPEATGGAANTNGETPVKSPDPTEMSMDDWDFLKTGIPVLVLNTGEHVRSQKLSIVLAEKGTGFSLWEDEMTVSTRYSTVHPNFHTMTLSKDAGRLVGFSFDEANAAAEFADAVNALLPKPEEESTDKKKKKKKKKEKTPKLKYKPPKKIDISQPCCFVHVTKLERPNVSLFPSPPNGTELSRTMERSKSESSQLSEYSTSTPSEN